jgi:hypothetical protein
MVTVGFCGELSRRVQPPDAENRMSGGVGEVTGAIPSPRPDHPFPWNPERRDELRYLLDPDDVMGADYPSETFRVLKNDELREFGEYRTRRLVLKAWDELEAGYRESVA